MKHEFTLFSVIMWSLHSFPGEKRMTLSSWSPCLYLQSAETTGGWNIAQHSTCSVGDWTQDIMNSLHSTNGATYLAPKFLLLELKEFFFDMRDVPQLMENIYITFLRYLNAFSGIGMVDIFTESCSYITQIFQNFIVVYLTTFKCLFQISWP